MKHVLTFLLSLVAWGGLMAQSVDKQTAYDSTQHASFSTVNREVRLNDFSTWELPFHLVSPPFMNYLQKFDGR